MTLTEWMLAVPVWISTSVLFCWAMARLPFFRL